MKVAVLVHFYVPFRNAGSETMLHSMLRQLQGAGHEVLVTVTNIPDAPFIYEYEGVRVVSGNLVTAQQHIQEFGPDVIVTHHDNTSRAIRLARKMKAKSVFLMHNDFPQTAQMLSLSPDLVVFNTEWMAEKYSSYPGKSMIVHPPVWAADHESVPGDRVTLVNLNEHKGSKILYRLAELMPETKFLGVVGGHGVQIIREDLPNVEIVQHTDDMPGEVWSKTRILLMPSIYESYGMAGVEAMASGIPVIANPTNGLTESLGHAGTFVQRDDLDGWVKAITDLSDKTAWEKASKRAKQRSKELNPLVELGRWVTEVERLVE